MDFYEEDEHFQILNDLPGPEGVPESGQAGTPPGLLQTPPPVGLGTPSFPGLEQSFLRELVKQAEGGKQLLQDYRSIQGLQLTALQVKILAALDDRKIREAPLRDLVNAFKVLKEKELLMDGKPTEIIGLAGYLQILEQNPAIDITPVEQKEELPDL